MSESKKKKKADVGNLNYTPPADRPVGPPEVAAAAEPTVSPTSPTTAASEAAIVDARSPATTIPLAGRKIIGLRAVKGPPGATHPLARYHGDDSTVSAVVAYLPARLLSASPHLCPDCAEESQAALADTYLAAPRLVIPHPFLDAEGVTWLSALLAEGKAQPKWSDIHERTLLCRGYLRHARGVNLGCIASDGWPVARQGQLALLAAAAVRGADSSSQATTLSVIASDFTHGYPGRHLNSLLLVPCDATQAFRASESLAADREKVDEALAARAREAVQAAAAALPDPAGGVYHEPSSESSTLERLGGLHALLTDVFSRHTDAGRVVGRLSLRDYSGAGSASTRRPLLVLIAVERVRPDSQKTEDLISTRETNPSFRADRARATLANG